MNTTFYLPGLDSRHDFSDLAEAADFSRSQYNPDYVARTVGEFLEKHQFWHWSGHADNYVDALSNWPHIPLVADKIFVHQTALEHLLDKSLDQRFTAFAEVWGRLFDTDIVEATNPWQFDSAVREQIFRQATETTADFLRSYFSKKGRLSNSPIELDEMWKVSRFLNIVTTLLIADHLNAAVLWPQYLERDIHALLTFVDGRSVASEDINSLSAVLATIKLPHVPLHDEQGFYPENVSELNTLRQSDELRALRSLFRSISDFQSAERWQTDYETVSKELENKLSHHRAVSIISVASGVSLGAAGIFFLPAGIAGLALAIGGPIYDYLLGKKIDAIKQSRPLESTAFKLSKILTEWSPQATEYRRLEISDISEFYRRMSTKYSHTPVVVKCLATTSSGSLCSKNAREGSFYCSHHNSIRPNSL